MGTAIKLFFSNVWDFLLPLIKVFLSQAGPILAKAATEAVTAVAINYGTSDGETKRQAAFTMIQSNLINQGIQLGSSTVNMAIEAAVAKLKEQ